LVKKEKKREKEKKERSRREGGKKKEVGVTSVKCSVVLLFGKECAGVSRSRERGGEKGEGKKDAINGPHRRPILFFFRLRLLKVSFTVVCRERRESMGGGGRKGERETSRGKRRKKREKKGKKTAGCLLLMRKKERGASRKGGEKMLMVRAPRRPEDFRTMTVTPDLLCDRRKKGEGKGTTAKPVNLSPTVKNGREGGKAAPDGLTMTKELDFLSICWSPKKKKRRKKKGNV